MRRDERVKSAKRQYTQGFPVGMSSYEQQKKLLKELHIRLKELHIKVQKPLAK